MSVSIMYRQKMDFSFGVDGRFSKIQSHLYKISGVPQEKHIAFNISNW